MRISDWSSDVCSSDLVAVVTQEKRTKMPLNTQDFPHFHLCFARREHMVGKKPARRVPDMQLDQIAFSRRGSHGITAPLAIFQYEFKILPGVITERIGRRQLQLDHLDVSSHLLHGHDPRRHFAYLNIDGHTDFL